MKINKKQFVAYTIFLLILGGTITLASGTKPEDLPNLWNRVWKVEQPVAVTLDEPIDVTLDEPIDVSNPSDIELVYEEYFESVSFERIHLDDISKYKYLYVFYAETTDPDDDFVDCKIYYELDEGNFHFLAGTLDGQIVGESPAKIEVASPVIEVWIQYTLGGTFEYPVYVAVYGSTK